MRKILALALALFVGSVVPAYAGPDISSGFVTLSAVGTPSTGVGCARVQLSDNQGAEVTFASSDLDGTVLPYVVSDQGVATAVQFVDKASGAVSLSYAGDGANDAASYGIVGGAGASAAMVCISALTSGSVQVSVRSTSSRPIHLLGTDGSNLRSPVVTNDTPGASDYALVVRIAGGSGTPASIADDGAFTVGTTLVAPAGGLYKSTLDSVDDGDAGALAMTIKRFLYTTIGTPAGDSAMNDTLDGVNAVIVNTPAVGGQSATSTTLVYPNGAGNLPAFIRPTTATTTLWITGEASEHIYVTAMFAHATAAQGVTIISGTGATCGTSTATVLGEIELTAGQGWTYGNGNGMVLRTNDAGDSLCVTTDSAAAVNIIGSYAIY